MSADASMPIDAVIMLRKEVLTNDTELSLDYLRGVYFVLGNMRKAIDKKVEQLHSDRWEVNACMLEIQRHVSQEFNDEG